MKIFFSIILYVSFNHWFSEQSFTQPQTLIKHPGWEANLQDAYSNPGAIPADIKIKRHAIPEEYHGYSIKTGPGYEREIHAHISDTGSILSNIYNVSERGKKKEKIGMQDGFKEIIKPFSVDEKRHIGNTTQKKGETPIAKRSYGEESENETPNEEDNPELEDIPESEDIPALEGTEDIPDNDENELEDLIPEEPDEPDNMDSMDEKENDFKRRSAIVDSDEDILGSELIEPEPVENADDFSDSLRDTEPISSDSSSEPADYERLLSEFEEDKEGVSDSLRHNRGKIPGSEDDYGEILSESEPLIDDSIEEEDLDEIPRDEIDRLLYDENEEQEEECVEPGQKRNIIEYLDSEDTTDDSKHEASDDGYYSMRGTSGMSLDCAECVNIDEFPNIPTNDIRSFLSCPASETQKTDRAQMTLKDVIMSSATNNNTRRSVISEFVKKSDFICNEKCKNMKRASISGDSYALLSQFERWQELNPDIDYHQIPRASVGILVDGNLKMNKLIKNLLFNIMLLHSTDSMITLATFRRCLKTMEMPGQVMLNDQTRGHNYINSLQQLAENIDLGPDKSRNIAIALGDLRKIIDAKAKEINTELKYIIVVTNGPFTDTGQDDAELTSIKEQLRQSDIQLYIIQLGSSYKNCQLQKITKSSKIIVAHYVNQLVYGGKTKQSDKQTGNLKRSSVPIQGALVVLQKKLMLDAKTLEPKLGKITSFENNVVGWASDTKTKGLQPAEILSLSSSQSPVTTENTQRDNFYDIRDTERIKRQVLTRRATRKRPRFRKIRRIWRAVKRNPQRVRISEEEFPSDDTLSRLETGTRLRSAKDRLSGLATGTRFRSAKDRLPGLATGTRFRPAKGRLSRWGKGRLSRLAKGRLSRWGKGRRFRSAKSRLSRWGKGRLSRLAKGTRLGSYPDGLGLLMKTWKWFEQYPILKRKGMLGNANLIVMMDTMKVISTSGKNLIGLIQKLLYFMITPFPYTTSKTSIFSLGTSTMTEMERKHVFARSEDIQRSVTSIRETPGLTIALKPIFVRMISKGFRLFRRNGNNVVILILTHPVSDTDRFGELSYIIRKSGIKLYILGLGLEGQRKDLLRLSSAPRVFTSTSISSFFKGNIFDRIIGQLKRDVGESGEIVNIEASSKNRRYLRKASKYRNSGSRMNIRNKGGFSRRKSVSGSTSRRKSRLRRLMGSVKKMFGRSRKSRGTIETPDNFDQLNNQFIDDTSQVYGRTPNLESNDEMYIPSVYSPEDSFSESFIEDVNSQIDKRQKIPRKSYATRRRTPSEESLGRGSFIFIVDTSFSEKMGSVQNFLKLLTVNFQRDGSYFTFASFDSSVRLHADSAQFLTKKDLFSAISSIRGLQTRQRNTGKALLHARRWLIKANPDYPIIIIVILNGPASDEYKPAARLLMRDGVKVMVIVRNNNVKSAEVHTIQSSALMSFRTSFVNNRRTVSKLKPFFKSVCGKLSSRARRRPRRNINQKMISKQWKWTTSGSNIKDRRIAKTDIATLLDMSTTPDSILKLYSNIINSYSSRSTHLMRMIGTVDRGMATFSTFKSFGDQPTQQLCLLSLMDKRPTISSNVKYSRMQKRDLIDDIIKDDKEVGKRTNLQKRTPSPSSSLHFLYQKTPIARPNNGRRRFRRRYSVHYPRINYISRIRPLINVYRSGLRRFRNMGRVRLVLPIRTYHGKSCYMQAFKIPGINKVQLQTVCPGRPGEISDGIKTDHTKYYPTGPNPPLYSAFKKIEGANDSILVSKQVPVVNHMSIDQDSTPYSKPMVGTGLPGLKFTQGGEGGRPSIDQYAPYDTALVPESGQGIDTSLEGDSSKEGLQGPPPSINQDSAYDTSLVPESGQGIDTSLEEDSSKEGLQGPAPSINQDSELDTPLTTDTSQGIDNSLEGDSFKEGLQGPPPSINQDSAQDTARVSDGDEGIGTGSSDLDGDQGAGAQPPLTDNDSADGSTWMSEFDRGKNTDSSKFGMRQKAGGRRRSIEKGSVRGTSWMPRPDKGEILTEESDFYPSSSIPSSQAEDRVSSLGGTDESETLNKFNEDSGSSSSSKEGLISSTLDTSEPSPNIRRSYQSSSTDVTREARNLKHIPRYRPIRRVFRTRRYSGRRMIGRRQGYKPRYYRSNKKLYSCISRTWLCLTRKLRILGQMMAKRQRAASYGPNKNEMVLFLLSGWPTSSRRGRIKTDRGFHVVAKKITRLGIRLVIVVMEDAKTTHSYAENIFKSASTKFIHGAWNEALSVLETFQAQSLQLFGQPESSTYGVKYSKFNIKKDKGFYNLPNFNDILPPGLETYMTTKYLIPIQKLDKIANWGRIIPGLRRNFLRSYMTVVIVVDVTKSDYALTIQRTIDHLIKMFDRYITRFSLVLAQRYPKIRYRNQLLNTYRKRKYFVSRVRFQKTPWMKVPIGKTLELVRTSLIPKLSRRRRKMVVLISQHASSDNVEEAASKLKDDGVVISVIGIERGINLPELQATSSCGQLLVAGHVSMMPIMLFRLQYALSLVVNGPEMSFSRYTMPKSTPVSAYSTVLRGSWNDTPQKVVPFGRFGAFKRNEVLEDQPVYNSAIVTPTQNATTLEIKHVTPPSTTTTTGPESNDQTDVSLTLKSAINSTHTQ